MKSIKIISVFCVLLIGCSVIGDDHEIVDKRPVWIKSQFSTVDGSHKKLEKFVKSKMRDPNSYEHISTGYIQYDDILDIYMEYKEKNTLGIVESKKIIATVDKSGDMSLSHILCKHLFYLKAIV